MMIRAAVECKSATLLRQLKQCTADSRKQRITEASMHSEATLTEYMKSGHHTEMQSGQSLNACVD